MTEFFVQGTNLTPQQLSEQGNLSVGGMVHTAAEWKPKPSYAARMAAIADRSRYCTVETRRGYDCERFKTGGESFCESHRSYVGRALGLLFGGK